MTPSLSCIKPVFLILAPAVAIWLAQRRWQFWQRARLSGLALAVWLLALLPVAHVGLAAAIMALGSPRSDLAGVPFAGLIQEVADTHGLDPALVAAVVEQESAFQVQAVSPAGAMGLMQIMPGTAAELGLLDPVNAAATLDAGAAYLSSLLERYDGDVSLALAAYNAGPGRVDACQCIPQNGETPGYVRDVIAAAEQYRSPVITLPYRSDYRLVGNGLHGEGDWPGRDYAAACGTPLYAPISGRVETGFDEYDGPHGSHNSYLLIRGDGVQVMMMHGEYIAAGQVHQGDLVGFESTIGNSSDCHTHLAVRMRGELIDPISILR